MTLTPAEYAVAARCRAMANNVPLLEGRGIEDVFTDIFACWGRNKFRRLLNEGKVRVWRPENVEALAVIAASVRNWDRREVLSHLIDGTPAVNPGIVQAANTKLLRENTHNLKALSFKVRDLIEHAKRVVSCQRILPVGYITEDVLVASIKAQQEDQGFGRELLESKIRYGKEQQEHYSDKYQSSTTNVLGVFKSCLRSVQGCYGPYRLISESDAIECLQSLREDSVHDRDIDIRVIEDADLPAELANWSSTFETAVAIDNNFLMKITANGAIRITLERGNDPKVNSILDNEIQLLEQIVTHIRHDTGKVAAMRVLGSYTEDVERTYQMIRSGKEIRKDRSKKFSSEDRAPLKSHL